MMLIGTLRPEEVKVFDDHAGYHQFHVEENQTPYGSFEVFWDDADIPFGNDTKHARNFDADGEPVKPGWYWWACFPGCLPDGEASGPFGSSQAAHEDADEWSPEYDD